MLWILDHFGTSAEGRVMAYFFMLSPCFCYLNEAIEEQQKHFPQINSKTQF